MGYVCLPVWDTWREARSRLAVGNSKLQSKIQLQVTLPSFVVGWNSVAVHGIVMHASAALSKECMPMTLSYSRD